MKKLKSSFTLIEMLIVVVIIGILASALIPRIQSAQARARDTQRKGDMNTVMKVLMIYYDDNNTYPPSYTNCDVGSGCKTAVTYYYKTMGTPFGLQYSAGSGGILSSLVPNYLTSKLRDPLQRSESNVINSGDSSYTYFFTDPTAPRNSTTASTTYTFNEYRNGQCAFFGYPIPKITNHAGFAYKPESPQKGEMVAGCTLGMNFQLIVQKINEPEKRERGFRLMDGRLGYTEVQ